MNCYACRYFKEGRAMKHATTRIDCAKNGWIKIRLMENCKESRDEISR